MRPNAVIVDGVPIPVESIEWRDDEAQLPDGTVITFRDATATADGIVTLGAPLVLREGNRLTRRRATALARRRW